MGENIAKGRVIFNCEGALKKRGSDWERQRPAGRFGRRCASFHHRAVFGRLLFCPARRKQHAHPRTPTHIPAMKKLLAIIAIAAALVALPLSAADSNSTQRSITTMGTVDVTIPADSAKLNVYLTVVEPTLEQSNSHLDTVLASFQEELKRRGFPAKSVVLKNRDARKAWDDSNRTDERKFLGYRTSVDLVVSVDDISKLSPLITQIGLYEEYGSYTSPILRSSKIGVERKAVLASALRVAREKAEIIAKEGGAKLGALLNATEEDVRGDYYGNRTSNTAVFVSSNNASGNEDDSDAATPAGQHVISISVRIRATFALE